MFKFFDSFHHSQKLCWIDSSKEKIKKLEQQMEDCLECNNFKDYFTLMNRLEQEQDTLEKLMMDVQAPTINKHQLA